jgi:hypothetical protein
VWSTAAAATDAKPWGHLPLLDGVAPTAHIDEQAAQGRQGHRAGRVPQDERRLVREERADLASGSTASIARPDAVRWAGSRTPTSVTSGGRPGARSSMT